MTVRCFVDFSSCPNSRKVDLEIVSDVNTLTAYWMGEISMTKALREKRIQLSGDSGLKTTIRKWMGRNYFSDVKPG
jgi:hypothetical protein